MDRILEELGSRSLISHLSILEMESVLAIKRRTGRLTNRRWKWRDGAFGLILRSAGSWSGCRCLNVILTVHENYWFNTESQKVFAPWTPCSWPSLLIFDNSAKSVCWLPPIKDSVGSHPWLAARPSNPEKPGPVLA